jgi:hypothetical protein
MVHHAMDARAASILHHAARVNRWFQWMCPARMAYQAGKRKITLPEWGSLSIIWLILKFFHIFGKQKHGLCSLVIIITSTCQKRL